MGRERLEGHWKVITAFKSTWGTIQSLNMATVVIFHASTDGLHNQ